MNIAAGTQQTMLTDTQFDQLQQLSRKSRNIAVAQLIRELFTQHEMSEHDCLIDALDKPAEFKRYVRVGCETMTASLNTLLSLNDYLVDGTVGTLTHLELILALYQYQPNEEARKQLELRIVHQVPASRVAELTGTSIQHLSRLVSQYNKKVSLIEEVRQQFLA